jgi:hypothetical protein
MSMTTIRGAPDGQLTNTLKPLGATRLMNILISNPDAPHAAIRQQHHTAAKNK